MNAAQMVAAKLRQMDDAKGNVVDSLLARDNELFLRLVAKTLANEADELEKADHELHRRLSKVNLFRVMQESTNSRIIDKDEAKEINVMECDTNLVKHPQHDEWEPY